MFSELIPPACQCLASCGWNPPTELTLSAKEAPKGRPGSGEGTAIVAASAALSSCSSKLLAGAAEVFLRGASRGYWQGAELCAPLDRTGHSGGRHSIASPLPCSGTGARFSPVARVSCPHPSACMGCRDMGEGRPTASWDGQW